jgi:hypothetical protein
MRRTGRPLVLLLMLVLVTGLGAALGLFTGQSSTAAQMRTGLLLPPTDLVFDDGVLRWTASASSWATGTRVYSSSSSVGPFIATAELPGLSRTEFDDGTVQGTTYYELRAYYDRNGADWTSVASNRVIATVSPRLVLSTTTARPGGTLEGFLGGMPRGETVRFRYDSPTGPELSGSVGGAAVPATLAIAGDMAVTVVLPAGATNGAHTIFAVSSPSGTQASAAVTVDTTPPVAPTITGKPPAVAGGTSVVYEFTHPDPDVTFTCSRDGGPWAACTSPRTLGNLSDGPHTFGVRATDPQGLTGPVATHDYVVDSTPPPPPTFSSTPFAVESSTAASFVFGSAEAGASYVCSLDDSVPAPCTSPVSHTVTNGEHVFAVRAVDAVGNLSAAATFQWLVDTSGFRVYNTTPPSGAHLGPVSYERGCGTPTTGDFCGNAMDGPDQLVHRVQLTIRKGKTNPAYWTGSNWNGSTEEANWQTIVPSADRRSWVWPFATNRFTPDTYIVRVRAVTATGVTSAVTETEFTYDNVAPAVQFTAPVSTVYGADRWRSSCGTAAVDDLCGTAGDSSNSGKVSRVAVSLRRDATSRFWNGYGFAGDTEQMLTASGGASWNLPFEFTDFPADGSYTARVVSYDTAGNVSAGTSVSFTIDSTLPTATVTFPTSGTTYGKASYSAGCGTSAQDVCGTASDASGISAVRVSIRRGSGSWWTGTGFTSSSEQLLLATGTTNWSYALPEPALSGSYTIRVHPVDAGGNTLPAATTTYNMDVTPPPPPVLTGMPLSVTRANTATFSFTTTESDATFRCRLDGGTDTVCTSPHSYTGLPAGTRTFAVSAVDPLGNASTTTYTWVIDVTAPTVALTAPAATSTHSASTWRAMCGTAEVAEVCGTATDTGGGQVAEVRVSLQQGTGTSSYWDGSGFGGGATLYSVASGTTAWTWAFDGASFPASGNYTLRVVAVDTAGNVTGTPLSRTFSVDVTPPVISAWSFPTAGGSYTSLQWNNGCVSAPRGDFCGSAGDSGGAGLSKVEVSVRRGTGNYWDGLAFSSPTEVMLPTTGLTSWNRLLPAAALDPGGTYTLRVVATDSVGNATSTSRSFTSAPVIRHVRPLGTAAQCTGSSLSVTVPSDGIPPGRKLIAQVVLRSAKTDGTVSMPGWTLDADVNRDGLVRTLVWSRYVSTALTGGTAFTLNYPTNQSASLDISEWVGISSVQNDGKGFDQVQTGSGSGGVNQSMKVSTPDSLVVTTLGIGANVTVTEGTGWTSLGTRSLNCANGRFDARGAYQLGSPSSDNGALYNPTFPSANWALVMVSYRP